MDANPHQDPHSSNPNPTSYEEMMRVMMDPMTDGNPLWLDVNPVYYAQDVRRRCPGVPTPEEVVNRVAKGIKIKYLPLEGTGYLIKFRDGTGEIMVAERLGEKEQRLTILHELAHWHLRLPGNLDNPTGSGQRVEDWCETFAQYLECMCSG